MKENKIERIYIAGPMTGLPNYNWDKFCNVSEELRKQGYEVVNPAEITDNEGGQDAFVNSKEHADKVIKIEMDEIKKCDSILLLSGWENSNGAKEELKCAIENKLSIYLEVGGIGKDAPFIGYVRVDSKSLEKFPKPTIVDMNTNNCTYYKDVNSALVAFKKETGESVYNIGECFSSGRFIEWLFKPHVFTDEELGLNQHNDVEIKDKEVTRSRQIESMIGELLGMSDVIDMFSDENKTAVDFKRMSSRIKEIANEFDSLELVPNINYQGIFDEALEMSYVLRKIDRETHDCAMCKGDGEGSYSTNDYLKNICEILYSSEGNYKQEKYS